MIYLSSPLTPSDWISILDIGLTSVIGIWIGVSVQKNLTTNRAVKEYFINENSEIRNDYIKFIDELYASKLSSEQIKEWFRLMTIKLNTFEGFMKNEYIISPELLSIHNQLKHMLTGSDDFNDQYRSAHITFCSQVKEDILRYRTSLSNSFTKLILEINRANRRYFCKNKYGQNNTNNH